MNECRKVQPVVDAFVDGELSAERVIETEEHLGQCGTCQERVSLSQAIHTSTRRAVHDAGRVSASFEARVTAALTAERAREEAAQTRGRGDSNRGSDRGKALPWRAMVPVAAAAAVTLAFANSKSDTKKPFAQAGVNNLAVGVPLTHEANSDSATSSTTNEEQLLEELIRLHASSPQPDVTEPTLMPQLERQVGLPVRLQPELNNYGARWQGGSVVPVKNETAASLYYHLDGHRLTVYVFDAERVPLQRTNVLKPRVVKNRPVFVGTKRGYSIAAIENKGVGYAIATDLEPQESAELIASIH